MTTLLFEVPGIQCPVLDALLSDDSITLTESGSLLLATFSVGPHLYHFTHHSIERLMERTEPTIESVLPHLDLSNPVHAVYAGIVLFREGKHGVLKNVKRKSSCRFSHGWLFPFVVASNGVRMIVTAFPKRASTRFFQG